MDAFPLPFLHLFSNGSKVHKDMQIYLWLATIVFTCVIALFITILVAEALPPGFYNPETGQLRYISDGFADYRAAPFVCLAWIILVVACLVAFGFHAASHFPGSAVYTWASILLTTGLLTIIGFALLASFPSGPVHFSGAATFITAHIIMQLTFLQVVWNIVRKKSIKREWNAVEWTIVLVAITAAILFAVLLAEASSSKSESQAVAMYSMSAQAEYFVFATFVLLNTFASCMMTYVAIHFHPATSSLMVEDEEDAKYVPLEEKMAQNLFKCKPHLQFGA